MSLRAIAELAGVHTNPLERNRRGQFLRIDPAELEANFNRTPFLFRHNLAASRLFSLPRLMELAARLPESYVEYNAGDLPVSIDARLTPKNGLSIEETIRRIEQHCSWMVLKRVEHDPEYKELLDRCLDEIESISDSVEPGMYERAGSIFISSPNSVTPYHMDHEINFLLQMAGTKTIHTFDRTDRSILSEKDLEDYFIGTTLYRNMDLRDEFHSRSREFELRPGHLLHVPATEPHWVKNGSEVSISFSVAFQTRETDRLRNVYSLNSELRRIGLDPRPYGASPVRDSLKSHAFRALRAIRSRLSGRVYGQQDD